MLRIGVSISIINLESPPTTDPAHLDHNFHLPPTLSQKAILPTQSWTRKLNDLELQDTTSSEHEYCEYDVKDCKHGQWKKNVFSWKY